MGGVCGSPAIASPRIFSRYRSMMLRRSAGFLIMVGGSSKDIRVRGELMIR